MSEEKKVPQQTNFKQPYGEPIKGSKKVKNRNHSRQKKGASHDL